MLNAVTSGARFCLRCETRLLLYPKGFAVSYSKPSATPRLCKTRFSSAASDDKLLPASAEEARLPNVRRGRIHGRPGRLVQEEIVVGSPSEVVILRDANLDHPKIRRRAPARQSSAVGSAQELQKDINAAIGIPTFAEVRSNLEKLRPRVPNTVLSEAECDELAKRLHDGFTMAQLEGYLGSLPESMPVTESTELSEVQDDNEQEPALIKQSPWKLGLTSITKRRGSLSAHEDTFKSSVEARKKRLIALLLRKYWKVQTKEDVESTGELELTLPPLEMSLLLGDKRMVLKGISERRRAKLDVLRSKGLIRITADQESAGFVVNDIKAALGQLRCMQLNVKPLRAAIGKGEAATLLTHKRTLQRIGQMTGTEVQWQTEGNLLKIHTLGPGLTSAYDARRLFLDYLEAPSRSQKHISYSRAPLVEQAALVSAGPVKGLPWNKREKSWCRLQLAVAKATEDSLSHGSRDTGEIKSSEDYGSIVESIQDFLKPAADVQVTKPSNAVSEEEPEMSVANEVNTHSPLSGEQAASSETAITPTTVAKVGYVLEEAHKPVLSSPLIEQAANHKPLGSRVFSHDVPGVLRALSNMPKLEEPVSECLLIHFKPSPWASVGAKQSKLFPPMEVHIGIDRINNEIWLQSVEAITEQRVSDLMLPENMADLRFLSRRRVNLRDVSQSANMSQFLAHSNLNILGQERLQTPPGLTVKIPRWIADHETSPAHPTHASGEVEVEYLFAGLEHRETITAAVNGWKAQYTTVEAGKTGGRRGEFQLLMERVAEGENTPSTDSAHLSGSHEDAARPDFRHFFDTALHFVHGLDQWIPGRVSDETLRVGRHE